MHVRCNFDTGGLLCCREKAKGVTFFEARDGDSVRPMLDVAWAPMLGAFRWGGWGETVACLARLCQLPARPVPTRSVSTAAQRACCSCACLLLRSAPAAGDAPAVQQTAAVCRCVRSVLFEEKDDEHFTGLCLNGIAQAVRLTCLLNMVMLRNTFVSSLARFTMLHSPAAMKLKSAWAFRCVGGAWRAEGRAVMEPVAWHCAPGSG